MTGRIQGMTKFAVRAGAQTLVEYAKFKTGLPPSQMPLTAPVNVLADDIVDAFFTIEYRNVWRRLRPRYSDFIENGGLWRVHSVEDAYRRLCKIRRTIENSDAFSRFYDHLEAGYKDIIGNLLLDVALEHWRDDQDCMGLVAVLISRCDPELLDPTRLRLINANIADAFRANDSTTAAQQLNLQSLVYMCNRIRPNDYYLENIVQMMRQDAWLARDHRHQIEYYRTPALALAAIQKHIAARPIAYRAHDVGRLMTLRQSVKRQPECLPAYRELGTAMIRSMDHLGLQRLSRQARTRLRIPGQRK